MSYNFNNQNEQSTKIFNNLVKPQLLKCERFKNMDIELLQSSEENISKTLDRCSGVDAILTNDKKHYTILMAFRAQYDDEDWETITVRYSKQSGYDTEYIKRVEAIKNGYLYPQLTLQTYSNKDGTKLLSMYLSDTIDVFKGIDIGIYADRFNPIDGTEFKAVSVRYMVNEKYNVQHFDFDECEFKNITNKIWKK